MKTLGGDERITYRFPCFFRADIKRDTFGPAFCSIVRATSSGDSSKCVAFESLLLRRLLAGPDRSTGVDVVETSLTSACCCRERTW